MSESIDLTPGPGGIVLIATQPPAVSFIESVRNRGYAGPLIVVVDEARPLPAIEPRWACDRVSVAAAEVVAILPRIARMPAPLGCVVGWHGIFPRDLVDAFRGRLLNVHSGDLPRYRGAGGGSWQVLNGARHVVAHVQQMVFALDRGPLLHGEAEQLPEKPYPADVKAAAARATRRAVVWLADAVLHGSPVALRSQDEDQATYFPRLDSAVHAWIDLTWDVESLERFVRAFSDPYPGAAFRYGDVSYRVRRAWVRGDDLHLHPFCSGLIVNRDDRSLHVAARDGVLCLAEIAEEGGSPVPLERFRVGDRIWCDPADLLHARWGRATGSIPIATGRGSQ